MYIENYSTARILQWKYSPPTGPWREADRNHEETATQSTWEFLRDSRRNANHYLRLRINNELMTLDICFR